MERGEEGTAQKSGKEELGSCMHAMRAVKKSMLNLWDK